MKKIRGQPAAGIMGGKGGKQGKAGGDFQRGSGPKAENGFQFSVMLLSFPASESVRTEHLHIKHLMKQQSSWESRRRCCGCLGQNKMKIKHLSQRNTKEMKNSTQARN